MRKKANKIYVLFLSMLCIFSFIACDNNVPPTPTPEEGACSTINYYVSSNGIDSNDGLTLDKSVTLPKALDLVKLKQKEKNLKDFKSIKINLAKGNYNIDESIIVTFEHTLTLPLTINGEDNTIISGGKTYKGGFEEYKDGIYRRKINDNLVDFRQIYVNHEPTIRSRFPNTNNVTSTAWDFDNQRLGISHNLTDININNAGLSQELKYAELFIMREWAQMVALIDKAYRYKNNVFFDYKHAFNSEIFKEKYPGAGVNSPVWLENSLKFIDLENEWFFDKDERYLYYKPFKDININDCEITIPQTENLFTAVGSFINRKWRRPTNLTIENIVFSDSNWNKSTTGNGDIREIGYGDVQSGIYSGHTYYGSPVACWFRPPSAVTVYCGDNVNINNCVIRNTGSTAVDIKPGSKNTKITNSIIKNSAGNGLVLGYYGEENEKNKPFKNDPDLEVVTTNTLIKNNHIFNTGLGYRSGGGVTGGYMIDVNIENNTIENSSYSGISLGWGWESTSSEGDLENTYMSGYNIKNNIIRNSLTSGLFDGADIYLLGNHNSKGKISEISNNYLEASGVGYGSIYFDENSSYFIVKNNVIKGAGKLGWLFMHDIRSALHNISIDSNYTTTNKYAITKGDNLLEQRKIFLKNTITVSNEKDFSKTAKDIIAKAGKKD